MKLLSVCITLLLTAALSACQSPPPPQPEASSGLSSVLSQLPGRDLSRFNGPVQKHTIGGKDYYYVRSPCCDFPNPLYDARGAYVCAPNGGFTGQGDRKCPSHLRRAYDDGPTVPNPFYKH